MTEGSFGVEGGVLVCCKLSSRAMPTNSYEFAGAGVGQGGWGGTISGQKGGSGQLMSFRLLSPF